MKKQAFMAGAVLGMGLLLGGCGNGVPGCGDSDVLKEVKKELVELNAKNSSNKALVRDAVREMFEDADFKFSKIITDDFNEKVKKATCRASFSINLSKSAIDDAFEKVLETTTENMNPEEKAKEMERANDVKKFLYETFHSFENDVKFNVQRTEDDELLVKIR